jgi:hypothetical protein
MSLWDLFRKPKPQPPADEKIYPAEVVRFFVTERGNPVVQVKDSRGREGYMYLASAQGILKPFSEFARFKIQGEGDSVLTSEMLKQMGNTPEAQNSVRKI